MQHVPYFHVYVPPADVFLTLAQQGQHRVQVRQAREYVLSQIRLHGYRHFADDTVVTNNNRCIPIIDSTRVAPRYPVIINRGGGIATSEAIEAAKNDPTGPRTPVLIPRSPLTAPPALQKKLRHISMVSFEDFPQNKRRKLSSDEDFSTDSSQRDDQ